MAYKAFAKGDAETVQIWSTLTEKKAEQKAYFKKGRDISERPDSTPFRRRTELEKENDSGDTIHITAYAPLLGDGAYGDELMEGKGEAFVTDVQDVVIDQIRHEVTQGGSMSQKRVVLRFRDMAKDALAQWMARKWDDLRIITMSGTIGVGSSGGSLKWTQAILNRFAGATLVAPDASHIYYANDKANDAALTATDTFGARTISVLRKIAISLDTPVKPITEDGQEMFTIYVSARQALDLKFDEDWRNTQNLANVRGSRNPLFTGALGVYDNCIIREVPRMVRPLANVTRAVLCGADHVFEAFGMSEGAVDNPIAWNEERWDRGRRKVITIGSIGGMRVNTFQGNWLNAVACDTWDAG